MININLLALLFISRLDMINTNLLALLFISRLDMINTNLLALLFISRLDMINTNLLALLFISRLPLQKGRGKKRGFLRDSNRGSLAPQSTVPLQHATWV